MIRLIILIVVFVLGATSLVSAQLNPSTGEYRRPTQVSAQPTTSAVPSSGLVYNPNTGEYRRNIAVTPSPSVATSTSADDWGTPAGLAPGQRSANALPPRQQRTLHNDDFGRMRQNRPQNYIRAEPQRQTSTTRNWSITPQLNGFGFGGGFRPGFFGQYGWQRNTNDYDPYSRNSQSRNFGIFANGGYSGFGRPYGSITFNGFGTKVTYQPLVGGSGGRLFVPQTLWPNWP